MGNGEVGAIERTAFAAFQPLLEPPFFHAVDEIIGPHADLDRFILHFSAVFSVETPAVIVVIVLAANIAVVVIRRHH